MQERKYGRFFAFWVRNKEGIDSWSQFKRRYHVLSMSNQNCDPNLSEHGISMANK